MDEVHDSFVVVFVIWVFFKHKECKHFVKIQLHSTGCSEHFSLTQEY